MSLQNFDRIRGERALLLGGRHFSKSRTRQAAPARYARKYTKKNRAHLGSGVCSRDSVGIWLTEADKYQAGCAGERWMRNTYTSSKLSIAKVCGIMMTHENIINGTDLKIPRPDWLNNLALFCIPHPFALPLT